MTIRLGVNIDHVATLRQARLGHEPNILVAAQEACSAGADIITLHLREDRRHIQDSDVVMLVDHVPVNLEMAATQEMVDIACQVRPKWCCIVPEKREELTTEGGLDLNRSLDLVKQAVSQLQAAQIKVSLFLDTQIESVHTAHDLQVDAIEFHTGILEHLPPKDPKTQSFLTSLHTASIQAHHYDIAVHAGHGLNYQNIALITPTPHLKEVNIGHSIICRSIGVGLHQAVTEMKALTKI